MIEFAKDIYRFYLNKTYIKEVNLSGYSSKDTKVSERQEGIS